MLYIAQHMTRVRYLALTPTPPVSVFIHRSPRVRLRPATPVTCELQRLRNAKCRRRACNRIGLHRDWQRPTCCTRGLCPNTHNRNSPTAQDGPRHIGQIIACRPFQGPIPTRSKTSPIRAILPGAADRILKMAGPSQSPAELKAARSGAISKAMIGTILAYITFAGSMLGALYLYSTTKTSAEPGRACHDSLPPSSPKFYADFVRPRRRTARANRQPTRPPPRNSAPARRRSTQNSCSVAQPKRVRSFTEIREARLP